MFKSIILSCNFKLTRLCVKILYYSVISILSMTVSSLVTIFNFFTLQQLYSTQEQSYLDFATYKKLFYYYLLKVLQNVTTLLGQTIWGQWARLTTAPNVKPGLPSPHTLIPIIAVKRTFRMIQWKRHRTTAVILTARIHRGVIQSIQLRDGNIAPSNSVVGQSLC